jgi:hypothetical protein
MPIQSARIAPVPTRSKLRTIQALPVSHPDFQPAFVSDAFFSIRSRARRFNRAKGAWGRHTRQEKSGTRLVIEASGWRSILAGEIDFL